MGGPVEGTRRRTLEGCDQFGLRHPGVEALRQLGEGTRVLIAFTSKAVTLVALRLLVSLVPQSFGSREIAPLDLDATLSPSRASGPRLVCVEVSLNQGSLKVEVHL